MYSNIRRERGGGRRGAEGSLRGCSGLSVSRFRARLTVWTVEPHFSPPIIPSHVLLPALFLFCHQFDIVGKMNVLLELYCVFNCTENCNYT